MKKTIYYIAIIVTVLSVLLSFLYIILRLLSGFMALPVLVEDNVLFVDWFFLAVPILALASGVLLQIASLKGKKKKKAPARG